MDSAIEGPTMKMIASLFCTEPETKFTLKSCIAINRSPLCRQLGTHILNIFGELLETGVT